MSLFIKVSEKKFDKVNKVLREHGYNIPKDYDRYGNLIIWKSVWNTYSGLLNEQFRKQKGEIKWV